MLDDENIMHQLTGVDCPFVSADAMRLLMEHGGNANLMFGGKSMFRKIDFDSVFGNIEQDDRQYDNCLVHVWLFLTGCGGRLPDNVCPLKMKNGYSHDIFRQANASIGRQRILRKRATAGLRTFLTQNRSDYC